MNKRIRLTENDIHRIVKESIRGLLREMTYDWENDYPYGSEWYESHDAPIPDPQVGTEQWFEDEMDPHRTSVGYYDDMGSNFVDWANMNDEENDYDETKSWDNHFKKIENERSWFDFDRAKRKRQLMHRNAANNPFIYDKYMPKINGNIYDGRGDAFDYAKFGRINKY